MPGTESILAAPAAPPEAATGPAVPGCKEQPRAAPVGHVPGALLEAPRRVDFSLGCQKELRSFPGGPEESAGLMNPWSFH